MRFLKLNRAPDGATVYLQGCYIGLMVRSTDGAPVGPHTRVGVIGGQSVNVMEKPAEILELIEKAERELFDGITTHSVTGPTEGGVPVPAPSPR